MGTSAPGVETTLLPGPRTNGSDRDSSDPTIQALGSASGRVGSHDDVPLVETECSVSGTEDAPIPVSGRVGTGSSTGAEVGVARGESGKRENQAEVPAHVVAPTECVVCLHQESEEESVNEDMPGAVRWIMEATRRLMEEMGCHNKYPRGFHWLHCCRQPIHVTCMVRSVYRSPEWKCPHCRRTLASGLWGPSHQVYIDPTLWPGRFQDMDEFLQSRLTLTDTEMTQMLEVWDEEFLS